MSTYNNIIILTLGLNPRDSRIYQAMLLLYSQFLRSKKWSNEEYILQDCNDHINHLVYSIAKKKKKKKKTCQLFLLLYQRRERKIGRGVKTSREKESAESQGWINEPRPIKCVRIHIDNFQRHTGQQISGFPLGELVCYSFFSSQPAFPAGILRNSLVHMLKRKQYALGNTHSESS